MSANDMERHSEVDFETVIEAHLLRNGYTPVTRKRFDRIPRLPCGGSFRN